MGCNGGYLNRVWAYLTTYGTVTDSCDPYSSGNGVVGSCPGSCSDGTSMSKKYKCLSGTTVAYSTITQIQTEIMTNGPMQTGFTVYQDFYNYQSGIYVYTSGAVVGGHAVKIVGWGNLNGVNYWICANSWGNWWGESGYFRIEWGQCGINAQVWACKPNTAGL